MKNNAKKGFTLIELLVVVAIISLLSSIVLASLKSTRDRATASKFAQEMQSLEKGLEIYRLSNNAYPVAQNGGAYSRAAVSAEISNLASQLNSSVKIDKMIFVTDVSSNFHYVGGAWAVANNAYKTCGGVTIRADQYLVMFYYPATANLFPVENTVAPGTSSGYSCFIPD